ncbi:hypothetical protein ENBRE01_3240 [Enteropsectra breve]|nr:hypothetical protein ENBRE01_3240 [Enteropsectra breve]
MNIAKFELITILIAYTSCMIPDGQKLDTSGGQPVASTKETEDKQNTNTNSNRANSPGGVKNANEDKILVGETEHTLTKNASSLSGGAVDSANARELNTPKDLEDMAESTHGDQNKNSDDVKIVGNEMKEKREAEINNLEKDLNAFVEKVLIEFADFNKQYLEELNIAMVKDKEFQENSNAVKDKSENKYQLREFADIKNEYKRAMDIQKNIEARKSDLINALRGLSADCNFSNLCGEEKNNFKTSMNEAITDAKEIIARVIALSKHIEASLDTHKKQQLKFEQNFKSAKKITKDYNRISSEFRSICQWYRGLFLVEKWAKILIMLNELPKINKVYKNRKHYTDKIGLLKEKKEIMQAKLKESESITKKLLDLSFELKKIILRMKDPKDDIVKKQNEWEAGLLFLSNLIDEAKECKEYLDDTTDEIFKEIFRKGGLKKYIN